MIGYLAAALPLIYFWRFRTQRLDRDYVCYAYGGLFGGYLTNGHQDLKPPAIHWGYTLWLSLLKNVGWTLETKLRLMPALAASASVALVNYTQGAGNAWVLAILWASPFAWQHMANTEWLTAFLLALWFALLNTHPAIAWLICGASVWVNQKNVLIVALCLAVNFLNGNSDTDDLFSVVPAIALAICTFSLPRWKGYLYEVPRKMNNRRTFRINTLQHFHLLRPWLNEALMTIPFMDFQTALPVLFFGCIALLIYSKQIMPHHFILLGFTLAICIQPSAPLFIGMALMFCSRSLPVWLNPKILYASTFSYSGGSIRHYGQILDDSRSVESWLMANVPKDEPIFVNGMEAQIYTYSGRKSVGLPIWELPGWFLDGKYERPRIVVNCLSSSWNFDATGYDLKMVSRLGIYQVFQLRGE